MMLAVGEPTMWRGVLRISSTSDFGSGLGNTGVLLLQSLGLRHTATGSFESPAVDQLEAANHLSRVLQAIANPQQFPEVHVQTLLKHLWVYIDRAEVGPN